MRKTFFILMVSLFMYIPSQVVEAAGHRVQEASISSSLLNSLRQGGYILYVRHGEATVGIDKQEVDFSDCSTQRNLSEVGKRQAVTYGETLRRLHIPVQLPVSASPFCRTKETAELAFGKENVQVDQFWVNVYKLSDGWSASGQESVLTVITSVLEVMPPAGKNQVIIDHSFPKGVGLGEIPNMGTVILKPRGKGNGYEVVAKLPLAEFMSQVGI